MSEITAQRALDALAALPTAPQLECGITLLRPPLKIRKPESTRRGRRLVLEHVTKTMPKPEAPE